MKEGGQALRGGNARRKGCECGCLESICGVCFSVSEEAM